MRKNLFISAAVIIATVGFIACKKNKDEVADNPPSDAAWNSLIDNNIAALTQTATFDASNANYVFTSNKGTKVTLNGTSLRKAGAPVTGPVTLEFLELYSRADLALTNKPTMGKSSPQGEVELLQTSGSMNIKVKQAGVELTTTTGAKIETLASNSGGFVAGMSPFNGVVTNNKLVWETAQNWEIFPVGTSANPAYRLDVPGFGWFNSDKFYSFTGPKTTITAQVPQGYANNCALFLFAKQRPNSLGGLAGKWPIGLECYLMFLTVKDGNYRWITEETTLTANHTVRFDISKATVGTKEDYLGHVTLLR
jgi:hypothetical protein